MGITKTKTVKVYNVNIDIDVLKYTYAFPYLRYISKVEVIGDYLYITISVDVDEDEVFNIIEQHQSLEGDYSALQDTIMENKFNELKYWVQEHLDLTAQYHDYDDIKSARSYTGFANPFQEECLKLSTWSSDVWTSAITVMQDIKNGLEPFPTHEELIQKIPPCPLGVIPT